MLELMQSEDKKGFVTQKRRSDPSSPFHMSFCTVLDIQA